MAKPKRRPEPSAQTVPMPPPGIEAVTCWCGAKYLDVPAGRNAHETVFGHQPSKEDEK